MDACCVEAWRPSEAHVRIDTDEVRGVGPPRATVADMNTGLAAPLVSNIVVGVSCAPDLADPPLLQMADADRRVVAQAITLAAAASARVHVVHVLDSIDAGPLSREQTIEALVKASLQSELMQLAERAAAEGVTLTHGFRSGTPWFELIQEVHERGADLVMVARRRASVGPMQRIFYGSTARRLLRKAPCAVCVVDPGRPVGFRRVMALVDRTEVSREVVRAASGVADLSCAERHLLHSLEYPADIAMRRLPDAAHALSRYHETTFANARRELDELTDGDARWQAEVSKKWIAEAARDAVDLFKIDLMVLSSVSKTGIAGLLLGTTAEAILERAPVSVWVIRPEGWRSPVLQKTG